MNSKISKKDFELLLKFLCFFFALLAFHLNLYGQIKTKMELKYKVKVPKAFGENCQPEFIYNIDSLFIFSFCKEGCDSCTFQCINSITGLPIWTISGREYTNIEFYNDSYCFIKNGVVYKNSITTGKTTWFKFIDTNLYLLNLNRITENGLILISAKKNIDSFIYEIIQVKFEEDQPHRLAFHQSKQFLFPNFSQRDELIFFPCKSGIELFLYKLNTENGNIEFLKQIKLPADKEIFSDYRGLKNHYYLINKKENKKNMFFVDSLYKLNFLDGSLKYTYSNQRHRYFDINQNNRNSNFDSGYIIYPQVDTNAFKNKVVKESLILINLDNNIYKWKYDLPEKPLIHNNIDDIYISNDSINAYVLLDNVLMVFNMKTGELIYTYKHKGTDSKLFSSDNFILLARYKNFRFLETVIIEKHKPLGKPIKTKFYPISVGNNSDKIFFCDKSYSNIYKFEFFQVPEKGK